MLLAHLDAADREAMLDKPLRRYTPHTVTQPAELAAELDRARQGRVRHQLLQQLEMGLHAVAVASIRPARRGDRRDQRVRAVLPAVPQARRGDRG